MSKTVFVRLDEQQYQVFEEVKKELGLKNDAEVFRYLLNYYYKKIVEKESAVQ